MNPRHRLTKLAFGGYVLADTTTLTWTELTDTAGNLLLSGESADCTAAEADDFLKEAAALGWLDVQAGGD